MASGRKDGCSPRDDPIDRAALLRALAFDRVAALAQSRQSGARGVRQPAYGRSQFLDAGTPLAASRSITIESLLPWRGLFRSDRADTTLSIEADAWSPT